MRRQHPHPKMDIPVSNEIWQQLLGASIDTGFAKEDWEIAAEAIGEWVRRHKPELLTMPLVHGYQWKSVFLPDGTVLRTVFGGKNHHCLVEGDWILYNGQAVSPSGFVNAVGGTRRNAWQCTWILLPDSKDWKRADTLRTRERPRRVRKPVRDMEPPAPLPAAASLPANVLPVPSSLSARSEYTADASEASPVQPAHHDRVPRTNPPAEQSNRRQSSGMTPSPAGFMCGPERRIAADDRMLALLRQELLPLLSRMSAYEGKITAHEPRA